MKVPHLSALDQFEKINKGINMAETVQSTEGEHEDFSYDVGIRRFLTLFYFVKECRQEFEVDHPGSVLIQNENERDVGGIEWDNYQITNIVEINSTITFTIGSMVFTLSNEAYQEVRLLGSVSAESETKATHERVLYSHEDLEQFSKGCLGELSQDRQTLQEQARKMRAECGFKNPLFVVDLHYPNQSCSLQRIDLENDREIRNVLRDAEECTDPPKVYLIDFDRYII